MGNNSLSNRIYQVANRCTLLAMRLPQCAFRSVLSALRLRPTGHISIPSNLISNGYPLKSNLQPLNSSIYPLASILLLLLTITTQAQSLQDYQKLALENNPSLKAKYKDFEAALTKVDQVKSLPDPTFSIGYFISPVETRVGPQRARLSLSQMFPWFGTFKAQGNVAALNAEASFEQFREAQNKIEFEVAQAYFPLAELNELIALQKQNLEILATWKRLATSQYENGKTTLADALRVDLMVNELKTEIPLLEDKHRPLQIAFNRLLNRDDSIAIDAQLDSSVSTFSSDSIKWEEHPRILELNKRIASKKYQSEAIVKQGAPKLGIGLDYVIVGERKDMAIDGNGRDAFMPMATMSIPIFRNKYKAAITETNLQIDSYEHSITATKNELITQLENAKYEAKRQEDLKALYEIQITQITQIQRLLLSEFSNSGKDLDELLLTQMKLLDYQMKEVKAKTATNIIAHKIDYLLARDHNETLLR